MELENKIAVISGGSTGIGKAVALRFIQEGAKVIVFGRHKPDYKADFYEVDIRSEKDIQTAFKNISGLDILVSNSGIYFRSSVEETKKEDLDNILDVNFKGAYLLCKHGLPILRKNKGNIVIIASCLGMIPEAIAPAY